MNDTPTLTTSPADDTLTDADLASMSIEELKAISDELGLQIAGDTEIADAYAADIEQLARDTTSAIEKADAEMQDVSAQMIAGIDQHHLNAARTQISQ